MAPTYFSFFNIDGPFICVAYQNLVFFLYTFQIPFWCGHIYSFSTQQHTAINNSLRIYMPINRKSGKATPPPHVIHTHTHITQWSASYFIKIKRHFSVIYKVFFFFFFSYFFFVAHFFRYAIVNLTAIYICAVCSFRFFHGWSRAHNPLPGAIFLRSRIIWNFAFVLRHVCEPKGVRFLIRILIHIHINCRL